MSGKIGKNPSGTNSTIAREYRRKYGNKMGSLTLAKIMFANEKKIFTSVESARTALRYIEGKNGTRLKATIKDKSMIIDEPRVKSPIPMPDSWSKVKPVFKLPIACNKIGFMSDFQIPFHDPKSIKAFVLWLQAKGINTLFINGDFCDFYGISDFQKDPKQRDFNAELDACRAMLAWLRQEFPTQTIYYNLDANHEMRWERWLYRRPEVLNMPEFQMDVILRLNEHNIIPLRSHKYVMFGKLPVLHGHTLFGKWGSGVSKGRTVFNKTFVSTIASHVHITDEYTKKDLKGKMITCWTSGCFMNVDSVEYNEHNDYNNGGMYIETDKDGNFMVENKRIYNGKVL